MKLKDCPFVTQEKNYQEHHQRVPFKGWWLSTISLKISSFKVDTSQKQQTPLEERKALSEGAALKLLQKEQEVLKKLNFEIAQKHLHQEMSLESISKVELEIQELVHRSLYV